MPRVVSVINYKGGVGKTTLTANIGAELANRGRRVLLIDLDPQASLTFSFYTADQWQEEFEERTILQWVAPLVAHRPAKPLDEFVLTPPRVNEVVAAGGGRLDLVASHLGMIDVDQELSADLGSPQAPPVHNPNYLHVHRILADALADAAFDRYDVVLIDCPPNFGPATRTGIVASDRVLVPARPDYLSTLGLSFLRGRLSELVTDYNKVVAVKGGSLPPIAPEIMGVVLTMVQFAGAEPIVVARQSIRRLQEMELPIFGQSVRLSNAVFGQGGEGGLPVVLGSKTNDTVQYELQQLATEFYARIRT